ncbi:MULTISPECIES: hypothetical protein [unclassified Sphingomonas]|jgi:hypothetical protein|uniref:hypothetical protein n=1 Tax=unclassified Sphingomonas TaxID=196159 RepID=UPI000E10082A|nr:MULTISPECIES: hypothetical protein [unclassified Sphingomonas]AXJ94752.1 hypothetical protein DM480_03805 [Sphingomonas sp. FARSPH]
MPAAFWGAGASLIVAVAAAFAERGRRRRADLDRIGWVDWRALQLGALVAAMILASIGLNAR